MENLTETIIVSEEILVALLLVASLVAIAATRLRMPYTVGLVLIGLGLTFVPSLHVEVNPEIILFVLVPPLIFEAAFHIRLDDLQRDWHTILLLAIVGVLLNTLVVAGIVSWGAGISFNVALVFGALIAATDPVAVVALFRKLGAPKRLQVLLEGESLFNDGTAIVLFGVVVGIALTGEVNLAASITDFIRIAGGALVVGSVLGLVVSQIISNVNDPMVETTLTTVLAFGTYLAAETLHVSGVLAVVMAGLVNGNIGPRGMSATTRVVVFNFWEYAAFVANSLVFLLIGLTININLLIENWVSIAWAILAILLARALSVYPLTLFNRELPWSWRHVLYWGGLRGAISLALALSLPTALGKQATSQLQAMAFGVVLFTLLVQGFSMERVSKWLKLISRSHLQDEYERRHARYVAVRSSYEYLQRMARQGIISEYTWKRLSPLLEKQKETLGQAVSEVLNQNPDVQNEEMDTARREALRVQRNTLLMLLRDGIISEENYNELVSEIDTALTSPLFSWSNLLTGARIEGMINRMAMVVIQERDLPQVMKALTALGISIAQIPSKGGFLQQHNVTLLLGYPDQIEEKVIATLAANTHHRVESLSSTNPIIPGARTRIRVGGAILFAFDVEAYYEF